MTLVSGNKRLMRIFAGFPRDRASNDSGVVKKLIFSAFGRFFLETFRSKANFVIYSIM